MNYWNNMIGALEANERKCEECNCTINVGMELCRHCENTKRLLDAEAEGYEFNVYGQKVKITEVGK